MPRAVKLGETLESLIEARGYSRARKKICAAIGISPSALTQYIQGQAKPSFDTLLALAAFFEVGLDYLVFGAQTTAVANVDYGPVVRYIDLALSDMQAQSDRRAALFGRIAHVLSEQIRHAADQVLSEAPGASGFLKDDETMLLESFSRESWIADVRSSAEQAPALGRFFTTVANNLRAGRRYHFLLPPDGTGWKPLVASWMHSLEQHCADVQHLVEHCRFRISHQPLVASFGLYHLDIERMALEQPVLLERMRPELSEDGWVGYLMPPSSQLHADALMDRQHLKAARRAFDRLWRAAAPV